jgi:hypothetical protein
MREMKQVSVLHMTAPPRTLLTGDGRKEALHHFIESICLPQDPRCVPCCIPNTFLAT